MKYRLDSNQNNVLKEFEWQNCKINFIKKRDIESWSSSALTIPFNEQLRIKYLSYQYEDICKKSGKELQEACNHYKQEHFRLRTGLSTVFPWSGLFYDKIIATVPPKIYSPKLLHKAILTTLDAVVDHKFSK